MLNGIYRNPTTIFFGKGCDLAVGEEVKKYANKILLHYGSRSFKRYGLYESVTKSLEAAGIEFIELGGVKSNPCASLVYDGIEVCRRERIGFILAVGGGSVIDSAKAIGIGVPYGGDFYDFFEKKLVPQASLNVGAVLTLSGAGSESSDGAVITHEQRRKKYDCGSPHMYLRFAMLRKGTLRDHPHGRKMGNPAREPDTAGGIYREIPYRHDRRSLLPSLQG
ncbi:MAG: iron-containing alcohol dehydrogenase [Desulfobacteraceae bacterium]|nr:iron-containing alcohol dehydrogenase [Desulfobacteraceae bacterium]